MRGWPSGCSSSCRWSSHGSSGPADGRYLLRARRGRASPSEWWCWKPSAPHAGAGGSARADAHRWSRSPSPQPVPTRPRDRDRPRVGVGRAPGARVARRSWTPSARRRAAAATLNRVLFAHRIATADPHVRELSPAQALVVRAGWGEGEQVAYGQLGCTRASCASSERRSAASLGGAASPGALRRAAGRARSSRSCARSSRCAPASTSTRAASRTRRSSSSRRTPPRWPSCPAEDRPDLDAADRRAGSSCAPA